MDESWRIRRLGPSVLALCIERQRWIGLVSASPDWGVLTVAQLERLVVLTFLSALRTKSPIPRLGAR